MQASAGVRWTKAADASALRMTHSVPTVPPRSDKADQRLSVRQGSPRLTGVGPAPYVPTSRAPDSGHTRADQVRPFQVIGKSGLEHRPAHGPPLILCAFGRAPGDWSWPAPTSATDRPAGRPGSVSLDHTAHPSATPCSFLLDSVVFVGPQQLSHEGVRVAKRTHPPTSRSGYRAPRASDTDTRVLFCFVPLGPHCQPGCARRRTTRRPAGSGVPTGAPGDAPLGTRRVQNIPNSPAERSTYASHTSAGGPDWAPLSSLRQANRRQFRRPPTPAGPVRRSPSHEPSAGRGGCGRPHVGAGIGGG